MYWGIIFSGQFWPTELARQVAHEPAEDMGQTVKKGMEETHMHCNGRDLTHFIPASQWLLEG